MFGAVADGLDPELPGLLMFCVRLALPSPSGSPNSSPLETPSPSESIAASAALQNGCAPPGVTSALTASPNAFLAPPPPGFKWQFEQLKVFPLGIMPTLKLLAVRETADVKEITNAVRANNRRVNEKWTFIFLSTTMAECLCEFRQPWFIPGNVTWMPESANGYVDPRHLGAHLTWFQSSQLSGEVYLDNTSGKRDQ